MLRNDFMGARRDEEHQGLSHLGTGADRNETVHNPGGIAHSMTERNPEMWGGWHLLQTPS